MKPNVITFTALAVIIAAGLSINHVSAAADPGGRVESSARPGTSLPADAGYPDGRVEPNGPGKGVYQQQPGHPVSNGRSG